MKVVRFVAVTVIVPLVVLIAAPFVYVAIAAVVRLVSAQ
jgi:hypothetical protein